MYEEDMFGGNYSPYQTQLQGRIKKMRRMKEKKYSCYCSCMCGSVFMCNACSCVFMPVYVCVLTHEVVCVQTCLCIGCHYE